MTEMLDYFAFVVLLYLLGLVLLIRSWFLYYRKIINAAIEYVGDQPQQQAIVLKPGETKKIFLNGKTTILVNGVNPWLTIKYNGIKQKVYKVRLLNHVGEIELINESKVFTVNVIILKPTDK
ncbi:MAG: hypothetical protein RQ872_03940 [Sulfolobaceae archaeon]|jgi:hypothetical protein|nr:hypothetical protein [Sulfolobaceae archaeon]